MCLGQKCKNIAQSYQCKQNIESWNICGHLRSQNSIDRGGSRTAATSKIEHFVLIVNGFQLLPIITKCCILDVAAVPDPSLIDVPSWLVLSTFLINRFVRNRSIVFCCALSPMYTHFWQFLAIKKHHTNKFIQTISIGAKKTLIPMYTYFWQFLAMKKHHRNKFIQTISIGAKKKKIHSHVYLFLTIFNHKKLL